MTLTWNAGESVHGEGHSGRDRQDLCVEYGVHRVGVRETITPLSKVETKGEASRTFHRGLADLMWGTLTPI